MRALFRGVSVGAALIVPLAMAACPGDGGNGTGGTGGIGGTPPKQDTVTRLCNELDDCNELVGIRVEECVGLIDSCLDEFPTQGVRDDWALFAEDCLEISTCPFFVSCVLDVADATGCPPFEGAGGSGGTVDVPATIEELCDELDFCGSLGQITIAQCIELTQDCLDIEYPTTTDEWVDAVQNCYDTEPTCLDYVNCLMDDADCPYFEGAGGSSGSGGASGSGGDGGSGGCSGMEITCYPDGDLDGWPAASGAVTACDTCPANFVPARSDVDCDDGNMDVYPGNEMFYSSCRLCGMECCAGNDAFDYNCDGESERQYPNPTGCLDGCTGTGFLGEIPNCGEFGDFHMCRLVGMGLCEYSNTWSPQACR